MAHGTGPRLKGLEHYLKVALLLPAMHVAAAVLAAPTYSREALGVFLLTLFLGQIGYTMGYHRLLTHRSFRTYAPVRYLLCLLALWAAQDGPIAWAAIHRQHHRHADDPRQDPHSPAGSFFHGYMGWILGNEGLLRSPSLYRKWAPDLLQDRVLLFMDKYDLPLLGLSGALLYLWGGLSFFVWGFLLRIVVGLHIFWILNACSHTFGSRPWPSRDRSGNSLLLGLLVQGEGWHNNHHYAPRSARHGFAWWQVDVTWYLIWTMEKAGLAWDVVRPVQAGARPARLPRASLVAP